jgi:hypothetical protein
MADERYPGCRMFAAADGLAGVVLQDEGNLAGFMWDFFVSPRANSRVSYDFALLAINEGGRMLTTREHPLLIAFFELLGFQAVGLTPGEPHNFLHMILLEKVFRSREPRIKQVLESLAPPADMIVADGQHSACSYCRLAVQAQVSSAKFFGGYQCGHCNFIRVDGILTLPPSRPEPSPLAL